MMNTDGGDGGSGLVVAEGSPQTRFSEKFNRGDRGLTCRKCGCRHFRVIYTRPTWGGRILRRRECRHCGQRIMTRESFAG